MENQCFERLDAPKLLEKFQNASLTSNLVLVISDGAGIDDIPFKSAQIGSTAPHPNELHKMDRITGSDFS